MKLNRVITGLVMVAALGACASQESSETKGAIGDGPGSVTILAQHAMSSEVHGMIREKSAENVCFGSTSVGLVVYLCTPTEFSYSGGPNFLSLSGYYERLTLKDRTPGAWFAYGERSRPVSGHSTSDFRYAVQVGGKDAGIVDLIKGKYNLNSLCSGVYENVCDIDLTGGRLNIVPKAVQTAASY